MTTGSLVSSTWWLEGEGHFISHTHWSSSCHSHDEALDHVLAHLHLYRVLLQQVHEREELILRRGERRGRGGEGDWERGGRLRERREIGGGEGKEWRKVREREKRGEREGEGQHTG